MIKTNKVIHEYLNSNQTLTSILQKYANPDQYLETAFLELMNENALMSLGNIPSDRALNLKLLESIDKAIITGHPDPNLFLLFIGWAIIYDCDFGQLVKANALNSIGTSFSHEEIQPIVRALYMQYTAKIKRREGNLIEYRSLMEKSISFVDKTHPRYYLLLNGLGTMHAIQGELKEKGEYILKQLIDISQPKQFFETITIKVMNAIITGNFEEGNILIDEYKIHSQESLPPRLGNYSHFLRVISGDFNESHYQEESFKNIVKAFHCLSSGRFEAAKAAIKYQSLLIKDSATFPFLFALGNYLVLHYEISLGNKGMARWLLQEKKHKGWVHYIDDLFYGRVQLLENDEAGADISFTRLMENVNCFGAKNRLAFELQFAKELPLPIILRLLNGWKSNDKGSFTKTKKELILKPNIIENGIKLLVGNSHVINLVKELVKKYANLKAPILVTGETGTGKELVSRAIHDEGGYSKEPFLAINCGALTDTLLQSELFGYEAGAFTGAQKERIGIFEAAGNGTVFLDEFGDISPKLQVSLLRVLESNEIRLIGGTSTRQIKCKIVIATNVDLHQAVVEKKFREDLFFRMSKFEIKIPALRERVEDIAELIEYFLKLCSNESGQTKSVSNKLLQELVKYRWPGNIRELKNEIDRLYILNPECNVLNLEHFDFTHLQNYNYSKSSSSQESISAEIKNEVGENKVDPILNTIHKGFRIEHRQKTLLELFKKYKKLTRTQIMNITKVSSTTTSKDLELLVEKGVIILRTPTQSTSTNYFEFLREI